MGIGRQELVSIVAENTGYAKKDVESVLNAVIETITTEVSKGEKVSFVGFGTFEAKKRSARIGRNPATGAEIQIPAKVVPTFSAGKSFKTIVNK